MRVPFNLATLLLLLVPLFAEQGAGQTLRQEPLRLDELIILLEKKHSTRIFYRQEWLQESAAGPEILDMPLERAISLLSRSNNLSVYRIDNYYVLAPGSDPASRYSTPDETTVAIGDPLEYGRYPIVTLSGTISDGQTGESLAGAVIYSQRTGTGVPAGPDGHFSLNLPPGEHRVSISFVGYETSGRRIYLYSPGEFDFELFEETLQLDEVTIMAQRAEANITRTRMSMISLDSRMLRELPGSMGEQDIIRSMSLLPGISTVGEFGTGFHVRGGSADQNLVLLEEVPLFNSSHLFGLTSVVNPDMVTGVTMTKAGIPARYGERAASVMDIRIRPEEVTSTSLTGGIGLLNSRAHLKTPVFSEKIIFSAGARTSWSDWLLGRIPDEDLMNSSAGFYDLTGTLTFSINPKNTITIFGYNSADRFAFAGNSDHAYGNTLGSVRLNSIAGEKFSFSINAGFSNYNYEVIESDELRPSAAYRLNSAINYRSLKSNFMYFPDPDHNIEFGFNAIHYDTDPGNLTPYGPGSDIIPVAIDSGQAVELAAYVSDNFALTPSVSIEAGLRYSRYFRLGEATVYIYEQGMPRSAASITDTLHFGANEIVKSYGGPEPRLGIRYILDGESSVKASYNRIHQYINLISNTSVIIPSDTWSLSDTHLKPLKSDHYAVGYFRNFSNNSVETSVELYYKRLYNVTEYKEGAQIILNERPEADLINAKGHNYGIEVYARKNSGRLTGWASYTLSASIRRSGEEHPENKINRNEYFPSNYDKPHDFSANLNYNITRRWILGGTFAYSSGRPVTLPELYFYHGNTMLVRYSDRNAYRLPDYHRLDLSLTLLENLRTDRRGKGHWTFSVINVYGRKNAYSVFYEKNDRTAGTRSSLFSLYKLYIIGRPLPTLTYNFTF